MVARSIPDDSSFDVPRWLDLLGGAVHRHPAAFLRLARLESASLGPALARVPIAAPIYICGLARAGTTLLHEAIASHPAVATHRMKDFPMVFTPHWWRRAMANARLKPPHERAHRDGVMVTSESPDALEEMLWMAHFRDCHNPTMNNVLNAETRRPDFEAFYRPHLRKLLLAENATRYAAKANYHVARLAYLLRLFPDAKFLIAVRSPERQIASLTRQHEWFCDVHRRYPRALANMRQSGHFEFGLDRRPIHLGDALRNEQIIEDWAAGREVCGWAHYWDMIYSYLERLLDADDQVRAASLVVRFETLCEAPAATLQSVFAHCALPEGERIVERFAGRISEPTYYSSGFSSADRQLIREATEETARSWGVAPQGE